MGGREEILARRHNPGQRLLQENGGLDRDDPVHPRPNRRRSRCGPRRAIQT
jgi:hypothetical protein